RRTSAVRRAFPCRSNLMTCVSMHRKLSAFPSVAYGVTEKTHTFFESAPLSIVQVPPGSFTLFLPTDAHLPCIGDGPIHKVVIKVAVD
ncbi:MAG: YhcH/YjgK/YiaL family protein, partial [Pontiella sp.]